MSMTVSVVTTNGIQYEQHGTDKQKAKAEKFMNMSNAETTRMAVKNYNKRYNTDDKKFVKKIDVATKSLPIIAAASSLALKQGGKVAALNGLSWGMALAAPAIVYKANDIATKASPKLKKFEKEHSALSFMAGLTASVGAFFGMDALMTKAISSPKMLAHPKVKNFAKNVQSGAEDILGNIQKSIKMPKKLKKMTENIKIPERLAKGLENFKNAEITKSAWSSAKSIGKKVIKNAPTLTVLGIGAALVGKIFQESNKIAGIKSNIRNAQFETAKKLVNAYAAENESLKEAKVASNNDISENDTIEEVE